MKLSAPEDDPNEPVESGVTAPETVVVDGEEMTVAEAVPRLLDRLGGLEERLDSIEGIVGELSESGANSDARLGEQQQQIRELYEAFDQLADYLGSDVQWKHR